MGFILTETTKKFENIGLTGGTVIKLENLSKKFGNFIAVNNVNLEVHRGTTIGLVGPNGAGKTTTIKMIAKLLRPTSGRILIKNNIGELQDLQKNSRNLVKLGFLIDIPAFYDMTAGQLLKYFALLQNYPRGKIDNRINELLTLFKLIKWKKKKIKTFSKGMRQKLGIIQALVHDPEIIILDEPQTGLDPMARIEIRKFIKELQNLGKTIFLASHMLYEISEVCDKIALINHGEILAFDTIENLGSNLKINELNVQLLELIPLEKEKILKKKLYETLDPYLDKNLEQKIAKEQIIYFPEGKYFKIYYKGTEKIRGEILKVLVKEFETDFTVISFTQPRTNQLERVYQELITDSEEDTRLNK